LTNDLCPEYIRKSKICSIKKSNNLVKDGLMVWIETSQEEIQMID
jgi:hypothetical protein